MTATFWTRANAVRASGARNLGRAPAFGLSVFAVVMMGTSPAALAGCVTSGASVVCSDTFSTTQDGLNGPADRFHLLDLAAGGSLGGTAHMIVSAGADIAGFGLAIKNSVGATSFTNNGAVSLDAGAAPTTGYSGPSIPSAVSVESSGNAAYQDTAGASITNHGRGVGLVVGNVGKRGFLFVQLHGAVTTANGDGIVTDNGKSTGYTDIQVSGTVSATNGYGIAANAYSGASNNGDVYVYNEGQVAGDNGGVAAFIRNQGDGQSTGTASIEIQNEGTVSSANSIGILAYNGGSSNGFGYVSLYNDGIVKARDTALYGINTANGGVMISNDGSLIAGGDGIYGETSGSGGVTVYYNADSSIQSYSGTNNFDRGIHTSNSGTGDTTINVNADIGSKTDQAYSDAILAENNNAKAGQLNITIDKTASVYTIGDDYGGIVAFQDKGGNDINIVNSAAITASQTTNAVQPVATPAVGSINSGSVGVYAVNAPWWGSGTSDQGNITIDLAQDINSGADGIHAENRNTNGNISINASGGGNITSQHGVGIGAVQYADSSGTSTVNVNVGAGKTVSGYDGGIYAENVYSTATGENGAINITNDGTVKSTVYAAALYASADSGGVNIQNNTGAAILAGSYQNYAVAGYGAQDFVLDNKGTITGAIYIESGSNSVNFTNSGVWNTVSPNAPLVMNDEKLNAESGSVLTPVKPYVYGSYIGGSLTNSGTINMTHDTTLGLHEVYVQGNYIGQSGILKMNAALDGTGAATDVLVVKGDTSGTTQIVITDTAAATTPSHPEAIMLVNVQGTSHATDFTLAGGNIFKGVFLYSLAYLKDTVNSGYDFDLVSNYAQPIYTPLNTVGTAEGVMQRTSTAFLNHQYAIQDKLNGGGIVTAVADPPVEENAARAAWIEGVGDWSHRAGTGAALSAGGYNSGLYGVIGGMDFGRTLSNGGHALFGVQGGWFTSNANISDGVGSTSGISGGTVGLSGTLLNHGFYISGLAQAAFMGANINIPGIGSATPNMRAFGGSAEVGYRHALPNGAFLEPMLTVTGSSTSFDPFMIGANSFSGANTDLDAGLGARLGWQGTRGSFALTARAWDAVVSNNSLVVQTIGTPLTTSDYALFPGLYGELAAKASFDVSSASNIFLAGSYKGDGNNSDINANVGFTTRF